MVSKYLVFVALLIIQGFVKSETEIEEENKVEAPTPLIDRSSTHHDPTFHGFWKKRLVWRPRWVKTWQEKKIYVAVWKKMWGPVQVKEWVPVPKPPPGWIKHDVGAYAIKTHPQAPTLTHTLTVYL